MARYKTIAEAIAAADRLRKQLEEVNAWQQNKETEWENTYKTIIADTINETVADGDWTKIDIEDLTGWLREHGPQIKEAAHNPEGTIDTAGAAIDAYQEARKKEEKDQRPRRRRKNKDQPSTPEQPTPETTEYSEAERGATTAPDWEGDTSMGATYGIDGQVIA